MKRMRSTPRVETPDRRPAEDQPRWRRDFPIDWTEDHLVARRDFTRFLTLTSLAFVVGQIWIGLRTLWPRSTPAGQRVVRLSDIPRGSTIAFEFAGEGGLLMRRKDGQVAAFSSKCTHLACAVVPSSDNKRLHCPCHNGWFDAETGRPLAGPPRRPLPRIVLEVRKGWVWAVGREVST